MNKITIPVCTLKALSFFRRLRDGWNTAPGMDIKILKSRAEDEIRMRHEGLLHTFYMWFPSGKLSCALEYDDCCPWCSRPYRMSCPPFTSRVMPFT
jgi:hypothetical protein